MDDGPEAFERYQRTRRRALTLLGGGIAIVVINAAYFANELRYLTLHSREGAWAVYAVGLVLVGLGVRVWLEAAALKARITNGD